VWDALRRGIDDVPAPLAVTVRVRTEVLALYLRVHAVDLVTGPEPGWTRVELQVLSLLGAQPLLAPRRGSPRPRRTPPRSR
jgi:hypothetical protein